MIENTVALIGLGAIGTPIAHKLNKYYGNHFALVASGKRRHKLEMSELYVNGERFIPNIISNREEAINKVELLLICVKNYDLKSATDDIKNVVSEDTIILPLQNGIHSYDLFCKMLPNNRVLQGYVQGPNTERKENSISYSNPGAIFTGKTDSSTRQSVQFVYDLLKVADVQISIENDIRKMVWKKWMLNVAGNSITALTGADYSHFKDSSELEKLCRNVMREFIMVASAERIGLSEDDIEEVIRYYVTYQGTKKTSTLEDVLNRRRTENEFLAGELLNIGDKYGLNLTITQTIYSLLKVKEELYLTPQSKEDL